MTVAASSTVIISVINTTLFIHLATESENPQAFNLVKKKVLRIV